MMLSRFFWNSEKRVLTTEVLEPPEDCEASVAAVFSVGRTLSLTEREMKKAKGTNQTTATKNPITCSMENHSSRKKDIQFQCCTTTATHDDKNSHDVKEMKGKLFSKRK